MFIAGSLSYPKQYTFFLPVKLEIADDVSMFAWFIITSFEFIEENGTTGNTNGFTFDNILDSSDATQNITKLFNDYR